MHELPEHGATFEVTARALHEAADAAADPIVLLRRDGRRVWVGWANLAFKESTQRELDDLATADINTVITSPHGELPLNELRETRFPVTVLAPGAAVSSWDATAAPTLDNHQRAWVVVLRPKTNERNLDELLQASEDRFRALAERAPVGIVSSEVGLRLAYVNDSFAELLRVPAGRLLGTGWMSFVVDGDLDPICAGLQATLAGAPFESSARLSTNDGVQRWVKIRAIPVSSPGSPAAFLATIEDVTERRRFEDVLSWQATHDPLTQLPNRAQLSTDLDEAIGRDEEIAVLFLDLDDFKHVNDTYGHQAGDELLITVATRLRSAVRDHDRVYRFGGDEFIVVSVCDSEADALGVADRLRAAVAQTITVQGHPYAVHCSVGVVRPEGATTAMEVIRDADVAMYEAKHSGKANVALFDSELKEQRERANALLGAIRPAIREGRIRIEYQPVVELGSGRPVGVEAQLRWSEETWGEVGPDEIVTTADLAGAEAELTRLVVEQATADLSAWRSSGHGPAWVSLRLSPSQLRTPGIADHVARCLVSKGLGGTDLTFGLSEEAWRSAVTSPIEAVADLLGLGVRFTLDDFGAANMSMRVLATAPVVAVKLHPCLTFAGDEGNDLVVLTVVKLAEDLGLAVIGSGIDSGPLAGVAAGFGIRLVQGSAVGHPSIAALVPSIFTAPMPLREPTEP